MPRRFSDDELKRMRNNGVKAPLSVPIKKAEVAKDPSARALQEIGKSLQESIQAQGNKDTVLRQEMQAILKAVMTAIEKVDGKEIQVELQDRRPRKWKHTVKRDGSNMITEIISEAL